MGQIGIQMNAWFSVLLHGSGERKRFFLWTPTSGVAMGDVYNNF